MTKRKVAGGYEASDSSDSDVDETPPKKPKVVYAPARLLAPKFNAPTSARSDKAPPLPSQASTPVITPGQKTAASSTLRTSFPTPRDTPNPTLNTTASLTANTTTNPTTASEGALSLWDQAEGK
jgi:hypothetical protein